MPFTFFGGLQRQKNHNSVEMNWHDDLELQYITEGDGYLLLNGEYRRVQKGDIVVANSNVIHYTGSESTLRYDCLIIHAAFCKRADVDCRCLYFQELWKDADVEQCFRALSRLIQEKPSCYIAKAQRTVLDLLIILREKYTVGSQPPVDEKIRRVQACILYIKENFSKKITLQDLSKVAYTNVYTLAKDFKRLTKQTVVEFINQYRCMRAKRELTLGAAVHVASFNCGFPNVSYFAKTFEKYVGVLPSTYKRTLHGE